MNPKPTGWDELNLVENPAVEMLESLGYDYDPPEDVVEDVVVADSQSALYSLRSRAAAPKSRQEGKR